MPVNVTNSVVVNPMAYPRPIPLSVHTDTHFVNQPIIVHQSTEPATQLLPPVPNPVRGEDIKALQEMFPKIEVDVIKSVLNTERGNLDRAINSLLELNSTT